MVAGSSAYCDSDNLSEDNSTSFRAGCKQSYPPCPHSPPRPSIPLKECEAEAGGQCEETSANVGSRLRGASKSRSQKRLRGLQRRRMQGYEDTCEVSSSSEAAIAPGARTQSVIKQFHTAIRHRRRDGYSGPVAVGTLNVDSNDDTDQNRQQKEHLAHNEGNTNTRKEVRKKLKKKAKEKKKRKKKKKHRKEKKKHSHVKSKLPKSSSPDSSSSYSSSPATELAEALAHDKLFLAQYLVKRHGMLLCGLDGYGPLHLAARHDKPSFVSWLLTQPGAAEILDMRNLLGETPLLVATKVSHGQVALRLVEALADPSVVDEAGLSPEALGLDALVQKAEHVEFAEYSLRRACFRASEKPTRHESADTNQGRGDIGWGEKLIYEMEQDEFYSTHDVFAGYEDLEARDAADDEGDSWMDDIAQQFEDRKRQEIHARMEHNRRVVMQAREEARELAAAQEERARRAAQARAASDAEFQKRWRQQRSSAEAAATGRVHARGSRGKTQAKTYADTRADDDARWRDFENQIDKFDGAEDASLMSNGIRFRDVPWPSGPSNNPLHIDPSGHPAVLRSQIRAGLLRWHPDKFDQRVGRFLPAEGAEREKALARVKEIAQQLNRLMKELVANSSTAAS